MTDLLKYDMTDIWASSGDKVAPDASKIAQGWGVEVVPRQWWNWFENRQDNNLAYLMQKGIPEWDGSTEYRINKSYVQRTGNIYKATTTHTNSDPVLLTNWVKAFADNSVALTALGGVTPATDRLPYFTNGTTAALATFTAFARTLLDDTTAATARTTLGAQASHANLTALSGVTAAVNLLPYFDTTTTMSGTNLTAFGRSLIDDADNIAAHTTLGLGTAAVANVSTTTTDTTAGVLLKTGDFGVGAVGSVADWPGTDLNVITGIGSGLYRAIPTTTNTPTGTSGTILYMVQNSTSATRMSQYYFDITTGRTFSRVSNVGSVTTPAWSAWAEYQTTANIATQAEAEAGTDNLKAVTSLRVKQAVTAYGVLKAGGSMTGSLQLFTNSSVDGAFVVGDITGNTARVKFLSSGGVNYIQSGSSSTTGSTADLSLGSPYLQTGARLIVKGTTGNVLIGTSTDDAVNKFQVLGDAKITGALTTTGALTLSTALSVANGGTGATSAAAARTNLGLGNAALRDVTSTGRVIAEDAPTGAAQLTTGTTAQRPASPVNGQIRYNTDSGEFEGYKAGVWQVVGGSGVGSGQTWQSVTRVLGTTYTNSTGKPILISVWARSDGSFLGMSITVNGVIVGNSSMTSNTVAAVASIPNFLIPVGATYAVTVNNGAGTLTDWKELR